MSRLDTQRRLAPERGGVIVNGIHSGYAGDQVRSLPKLCGYHGSGEYRHRYLGVKISPNDIREDHLKAARTFDRLADRFVVAQCSQILHGVI